jgi:hypothetical protein
MKHIPTLDLCSSHSIRWRILASLPRPPRWRASSQIRKERLTGTKPRSSQNITLWNSDTLTQVQLYTNLQSSPDGVEFRSDHELSITNAGGLRAWPNLAATRAVAAHGLQPTIPSPFVSAAAESYASTTRSKSPVLETPNASHTSLVIKHAYIRETRSSSRSMAINHGWERSCPRASSTTGIT